MCFQLGFCYYHLCVCVFVWILTFNTLAHAGTHARSHVCCSYHKHRKNGLTTNYFIPFHSLPNHSKWMWVYLLICVCLFVFMMRSEINEFIIINLSYFPFVSSSFVCYFFIHSFEFEVLFFYILPFVIVVVVCTCALCFIFVDREWIEKRGRSDIECCMYVLMDLLPISDSVFLTKIAFASFQHARTHTFMSFMMCCNADAKDELIQSDSVIWSRFLCLRGFLQHKGCVWVTFWLNDKIPAVCDHDKLSNE